MERLYPRVLLDCIREGRHPLPEEIEAVSARIVQEAFPDGVNAHLAPALAHLAMVGTVGTSPAVPALGLPREV